MQHQVRVLLVGILIEVIDPAGVEAAGPALDPVHHIALLQEQLGKIAAVLASNSSDQSCFGGDRSSHRVRHSDGQHH
jgi:hypothetical protein